MMNQLHVLQSHYKNWAHNIIASFLIISIATAVPLVSYAQTKNEIDQKNEQIKQLDAEIKKLQQELQGVQQQGQSLSQALKEIDTNKKTIDTTIKKTGKEVEKTNITIKNLGTQIVSHEQKIQIGKSAIAKSLRDLNESQNTTLFESILSNKPLAEAWKDIDEMGKLRQSIGEELGILQYSKEQLTIKVAESAVKKDDLASLIEQKQQEKTSLAVVQNAKSQLLKETQNKESEYQKIIADKTAKKKQFEQELFDYESKLKYTFKPGQIPAEGSHPLTWPTKDPFITQFFGATPSSTHLYASGEHSGVDFRAAVGTSVLATANGVVAGFGDTDVTCPRASFGKWIFIKNDNGLAVVYAHLSQINVKKGQRVVTGQVIGLSGNTGHSTAPHLHISVFPADAVDVEERPSKACPGKVFLMPIAATEAYLNPIKYLPAYTAGMVKPGA